LLQINPLVSYFQIQHLLAIFILSHFWTKLISKIKEIKVIEKENWYSLISSQILTSRLISYFHFNFFSLHRISHFWTKQKFILVISYVSLMPFDVNLKIIFCSFYKIQVNLCEENREESQVLSIFECNCANMNKEIYISFFLIKRGEFYLGGL
jgi:hypothetical protein